MPPPLSREEYQRRLELVEVILEERGLDALIGYSVRNAPGPVMYLVGYEPCLGLHDVAFFLMAPECRTSRTLLTNAFWDRFDEYTWINDVVLSSDFGRELSSRLTSAVRRVGIAGYRFFPAWVLEELREALPEATFVDATELLQRAAQVKSDEEVELLARCATMTDAAGKAFLDNVAEGVNERELKTEVEKALIDAGADGPSFGVQVYSGAQVAVGIGFGTGRTLASGDQVQVDCGALFSGYRGDLSRVKTVGTPSREIERTMETTARMYDAMLDAISPGRPIESVAHAALEVASDEGLGQFVYRSVNHPVGFVGHGIGCWIHEFPEIRPDAEGVLELGMVIVLEPILVQPGVGGAKIEDAVVVRASGAQRLSALDTRTWR